MKHSAVSRVTSFRTETAFEHLCCKISPDCFLEQEHQGRQRKMKLNSYLLDRGDWLVRYIPSCNKAEMCKMWITSELKIHFNPNVNEDSIQTTCSIRLMNFSFFDSYTCQKLVLLEQRMLTVADLNVEFYFIQALHLGPLWTTVLFTERKNRNREKRKNGECI